MNKKVFVYVIVVVLVICAGVVTVKNMLKDDKTIETSKNYNNIEKENKVANSVNTIENKIENVVENKSEDEEENTEIEIKPTNPEEKEDTNKDGNKEKAIEIVKKEWGEDDSVYFEFDKIDSNGNYRIAVRQKSTTNALVWYTVDVENEKIID